MPRSSRRKLLKISNVSVPNEILWAIIGLLLTIGGNFLEAHIINFPWSWGQQGVHPHSVGVTYQIGAVLLVGCLGGKNAGALSQIAYLVIGLMGFQVFDRGGGWEYLKQPTFGYLLGFIPGAWVCGYLAFRRQAKLEFLALSCFFGLLSIHLAGLSYLIVSQLFGWKINYAFSLFQAIINYSFYPLPGQFVVVCAVTVIAFTLRQVMFY
ncbi:MAG: biotin transporter BioY [Crinalium sp.]